MMRNAFAVCTLLAAANQFAHAQSYWTSQIGRWHVPTNWDTGEAPTEMDIAIISNGGTAIFNSDPADVGAAIFGFDNGGQSNDGTLIQHGSTLNFTGQGYALFGRDANTSGNLVLDENATLTCRVSLEFGWMGSSLATISESSFVEARVINVAGRRHNPNRTFSSTASVEITGPGTVVRTTDSGDSPGVEGFLIGAGGSGQVTIRNGALVETTNALLLSTTAQGSSLTIEGPFTHMRVAGAYFDAGRDITLPDDHPPVGEAVLTLRNRGTLDFSQTSRNAMFTTHSRIQGSGNIIGNSSLFEGAVIDPGEGDQYGLLNFEGQLDMSSTGGALHFDLGSAGSFDQISVSELIAGGVLEVSIADDFIAQLGQSFDIISADSITGTFTLFELPQLEGPLYFEADVHARGVTLNVVPTPATAFLLGAPLLMRTRRRK